MRNLVGYLYSKMDNENVYFDDADITTSLLKYETAFEELTGHNGINFSKEIIDDIVLLTHRDEDDIVYISASTLNSTDITITLKEDIVDMKVYPGEGIDIYIKDKDTKRIYLSNRIYYTIKNRFNSEIGLIDTQKLRDQNIYVRLMKTSYEDKRILTIDEDRKIRLYNLNFDLQIDVSSTLSEDEVLKDYINDTKKYKIDYTFYNTDIISIVVHNLESESIILDDILGTYIYSIKKNSVLCKLPRNASINSITNVDCNDYTNMMAWVTVSNMKITKEEKKELSKSNVDDIDPEFLNKFIDKQCNSFVNGLIGIYNMRMEDDWFDKNFIVVSDNTNDIGDLITDINEFYVVGKSDDKEYKYLYRFFYIENGKIMYNDVYSNTLPRKIYVSSRSSVLTFEYHLPNFHNVVSYWHDLGDIIKFSKIIIKANGLDGLKKVVKDIDDHLMTINDNVVTYTDEKAKLLNIIENKEYFEDKDKYQLYSTHLSDLTTGDIDSSCIDMSYGADPRFMMYKNSNRENILRKRLCIGTSLKEYYEREARVNKETMEFLDKKKKKLGLD